MRLEDICEVFTDGDWIESKDQSDEGIRLVQTGNIGKGKFLEKGDRAKYISEETFDSLKCTEIFPGDILVSRLPEPVGRACIIPEKEGRMITAVDCTICRPDENVVLKEYLCYFMQAETYYTRLMNNVTGTTRKRISRKNLGNVELSIPDKEIQADVVKKLDMLSRIIDSRKAELEKLDELVKARFVEMFDDPVHSEKYGTRKLSSCVADKSDMVDGPFGSQVNTKVDYIENGEIPVIRTVNVKKMSFSPTDLKYMTREKYETVIRSQVLPGDIILTKVGTIGNVCIFPNTFDEAVLSTTGSCRIRVDNSVVNTQFFAYNLMYLKGKLLEIASAGVQPFLNMNHVKNIDILDVPLEKQKEFADFVTQVDKSKVVDIKAA